MHCRFRTKQQNNTISFGIISSSYGFRNLEITIAHRTDRRIEKKERKSNLSGDLFAVAHYNEHFIVEIS